jgi:hypothetical protein
MQGRSFTARLRRIGVSSPRSFGKQRESLSKATETLRLYNVAAAVLLAMALGAWVTVLQAAKRTPLGFDDAYMFARYATHVRHGLGISWNPNGGHTYGETSLLWGLVVVVLSYLPLGTWSMLTLGSWLCSIGAVIALAWAVASQARSGFFQSTWRVLPLVALPLAGAEAFAANEGTGMETMLAALLASVFVGAVLGWRRGKIAPEAAAAAGLLLFLTRPDAGIAIVLFPLMLFALMPREAMGWSGLTRLLGTFAAGVALELTACKFYFHTMLPLSFYMKGRHAYQGYAVITHPGQQTIAFLTGCELFLLVMILLARRQDWRMLACCMVPAFAVFAYLGTVVQIMGGDARYYAPYFAFFVVPALLVLDRWINSGEDGRQWMAKTLRVRSVAAAAAVLCFLVLSMNGVQWAVRRAEKNSHLVYQPADLVISASSPLPQLPWDTVMTAITDDLVAPLPEGATVAATEVGYLGAEAPQVNVIDMAGLNDTQIAMHGFSVSALLSRKPDVIWMPNSDYTFYQARLLSDPAVLAQYDVYAGAANYGLAIRKDSPYHTQIEKQMNLFWDAIYPQYKMKDYLVQSASWTGAQHKVIDD